MTAVLPSFTMIVVMVVVPSIRSRRTTAAMYMFYVPFFYVAHVCMHAGFWEEIAGSRLYFIKINNPLALELVSLDLKKGKGK